MDDFRQRLGQTLDGSLCLVGLGAPGRGDDAFGVRLVTALEARALDSARTLPIARTLVAGLDPERHLGALAAAALDHVLFVDAVDFAAAPGAVVLLDSAALDHRYPQVSTHKLSLSLMARWLAGNGRTRTWLLGAQPESVRPSPRLSATLDATCAALAGVLDTLWTFQPWRPALAAPSGEQRQVPPLPDPLLPSSGGEGDTRSRTRVAERGARTGLYLSPRHRGERDEGRGVPSWALKQPVPQEASC